MNPRILELQHQAMSSILNGNDPDGDVERMYIPAEFTKKLAELIVRECAEVSKNYAGGSMPLSIALAIKKHFGVEE
jgi:hypothetical protein